MEVDILAGFPRDLEIVWGNHSFFQCLDYWKTNFRCLVSHFMGMYREIFLTVFDLGGWIFVKYQI